MIYQNNIFSIRLVFGLVILFAFVKLSSTFTTDSYRIRRDRRTTRSPDVTSTLVLYSVTNNFALLKPATGHSQPLWGPPDPYLSAGQSIPPSSKGFVELGIEKVPFTDLPDQVRLTLSDGYKVLDSSTIKSENILPGFSPVGGILPAHNPLLPPEIPATFVAQVEWSAKFINVIDHLPEAAFTYALIEFFILRPGIDLYKEDIEMQSEDGPTGVLTAEVAAVTGVRLFVFFVVAILTNLIFG
jgi:hypothetical protein